MIFLVYKLFCCFLLLLVSFKAHITTPPNTIYHVNTLPYKFFHEIFKSLTFKPGTVLHPHQSHNWMYTEIHLTQHRDSWNAENKCYWTPSAVSLTALQHGNVHTENTGVVVSTVPTIIMFFCFLDGWHLAVFLLLPACIARCSQQNQLGFATST